MQGCALAPCSGSLSLRLRVFPLASRASADSQAHSSIGTASGFNALRHLVGTRFQDLFHSPPGVLFTFPSRYSFAIGSRNVFSLAGRSPRLRTGFLVSRPTPEQAFRERASGTGLSPSLARRSIRFPSPFPFLWPSKTPDRSGLGSSAFARHYSRNRSLFLLLRVLRCFGSPGCLRTAMCSPCGDERSLVGFPHSEIPGSRLTSSSPGLIAGCRVLLRHPAPRHPPRASLTSAHRAEQAQDCIFASTLG